MARTWIFLGLFLGLFAFVSCKENASNSADEAPAEEAAEEMEMEAEAAPDLSYEIRPLPCFDASGSAILANIYQVSPADSAQLASPPQGGYWQDLISRRWDLSHAFGRCGEYEDPYSPQALEDYLKVPLANTNAKGKRSDLMPSMSDQFLNVNPDFIRKASQLLVPPAGAQQTNGFTYQFLYDRKLKQENQNLYLAHWVLQNFASLDHELREYVSRVEANDYQIPSYLEFHYQYHLPGSDLLSTERSSHLGTYVGFWLRRYLDGSAPALLEAQERVLASYDGDWYRGLRKQTEIFTPQIDPITEQQYQKRVAATVNLHALKPIQESSVADQVAVEENRIVFTFDNGNLYELLSESGEYEEEEVSYEVLGYVPGRHAVLVTEYGYEYANMQWVSLKDDGAITFLTNFSNDQQVAPGATYLAMDYEGYEEYGLEVWDLTGDQPQKLFSSPFLRNEEARWISDHELALNFGDGSYTKITFPTKKAAPAPEDTASTSADSTQAETEG